MADTTSTNYGFTKPEIGASSDTWGDKTDADWDLTDAALSNVATSLINGLTLSTAGSSATFGIAAGFAGDASGAPLKLASAYTKTTSAWAVGTATGSLDTGAIATGTWYHVWIIKRVDTGVVDILISLSATAPTMPTNYTLKRRIGAMKTNGSSQWVLFSQNGDEFLWSVPVHDISTTTLDTTATSFTLASVPTGIKVNALIRGWIASAGVNVLILLNSLDEAVAVADTPTGNSTQFTQVAAQPISFGAINVRTNTSAQIRGVASSASTTVHGSVVGWIDPRGKF